MAVIVVCGVPVRLQSSFLLLLLWAAAAGLFSQAPKWRGMLFMAFFLLSLYAFAFLHELGHILPAKLFGRSVVGIRLSGLGAFVQVRSYVKTKPHQELLVALGGPIISALLSLVLAIMAWHALPAQSAAGIRVALAERGIAGMLWLLAGTNALLTLSNLLPVFPMDGGRAIAAFLGIILAPARADRLVSAFSQVMSVAVVPAALLLTDNALLRLGTILTAGFVLLYSLRKS